MRLKKFAPLFAVAALMMALAIGCAPAAEQAVEDVGEAMDHSEMGHEETAAPDSAMMGDTTSTMPEGETTGN